VSFQVCDQLEGHFLFSPYISIWIVPHTN
jgi:hypothetical protein